ncbi:hypothetical protein M8C21_027208, partial [Ambrosia artemisiifolia]
VAKEIVSIYPFLSPPNLTPAQSNRVCNALALLQFPVLFLGLSFPCQKSTSNMLDFTYIHIQTIFFQTLMVDIERDSGGAGPVLFHGIANATRNSLGRKNRSEVDESGGGIAGGSILIGNGAEW